MIELPALHRNHRAFWRHWARACGGEVEETPHGLLVATGVEAAPFNQFHARPGGDERAGAQRARAYFGARGLPLDQPDFRAYLGRIDGRCVAISVGVHDDDTVGVYVVGVTGRCRSRGFGRALTARAIDDGMARGARYAVLQATAAGYRMYAGMGFREVGAYHMWDMPGRSAR